MIRHAGLVALRSRGRWAGALIEGPSGSGKSELAFRCLSAGMRLVADDRVLVWTSGGRLYGRSPEALAGLLELRGQGIVRIEPVPFAEVVLIARLAEPERMPEPHHEDVLGLALPLVDVAPFEQAAPAKLSRAIQAFDAGSNGRI